MRIKLRLYKYHDPELVQIYRIQDIDFERLSLECLRAFSKNEFCRFHVKASGPCRPAKRVYQIAITVDPEKDADVVMLLQKAKDGCMNAFIKTILKWYLSEPMPDILIKNENDAAFFKKKCSPKFNELPVVPYIEKSSKKAKNYIQDIRTEKEKGEKILSAELKPAPVEDQVTEDKTIHALHMAYTKGMGYPDVNPKTESSENVHLGTADRLPRASVERPVLENDTESDPDNLTDMFLSMIQG